MRICAALSAVAPIVPLSTLPAQSLPTIEPGNRVRMVSTECRLYRQVAEFKVLRDDTLDLVTDTTVTCLLGSVRRLDVQRGKNGGAAIGLVLGGLAGVVTGPIIGADRAAQCEEETGPDNQLCGIATPAYGLLGLMGGAAVGGVLANALIEIDRWEEVPLDRLRLGFFQKRDRFAVELSIAF